MGDLSKPVLDTKVPHALRQMFQALFVAAFNLFGIRQDGDLKAAAALLHRCVKEQVMANPILASIVFTSARKWSLLEVFCAKTHHACPDTIQFLIEMNPHALLWAHRNSDGFVRTAPIHLLPKSGRCHLLPWIAERYPWVLEHKLCQKNPPHLELIYCYSNDGDCDQETVRRFYEIYPQGLREKRKFRPLAPYPLAALFTGFAEPHADLFFWMAEQYPEAVYHEASLGCTLLHQICYHMAVKENNEERVAWMCTPNVAKICRYLISEHPRLVRRQVGNDKSLPIHKLARACNRPLVQEMVILLLRAFPECVNVKAHKWDPKLLRIPFIKHVHPLITKELEVDQQIILLSQMSEHMKKARLLSKRQPSSTSESFTSVSKSSLFDAVAKVFFSWANSHVTDNLQVRKGIITNCIAGMCRLMEADDISDGEWEDEDVDSDDDVDDNSEAFESDVEREDDCSAEAVSDVVSESDSEESSYSD